MGRLWFRLAVGVLAGLAFSQWATIADAQADKGAPAVENRTKADQNTPTGAPSPVVSEQEEIPTWDPQHPCENPGSREESDLCQQWRVAEATIEGVAVARRQYWATVAEAGLLGVTVIFTALATWAAARAANAADASIEQAAQTAKLELRAYLSVEPIGINGLRGSENVIGQVAVKNVGSLPARNVAVIVHMDLHPTREITEFARDADDQKIERVIQPGASFRQGSKQYLHLNEIHQSKGYVFVWGVAYYGDGYGERRYTRFCHRYDTASRRPMTLEALYAGEPIIEPEKARYHTSGNDAD